jgi:hypothetical protein
MGVVLDHESTSSPTDETNRQADTATMIQLANWISAGCQRAGSRPRKMSTPTCWLRASTVAAPKNTSTIISARATSSAQSKGSCRK